MAGVGAAIVIVVFVVLVMFCSTLTTSVEIRGRWGYINSSKSEQVATSSDDIRNVNGRGQGKLERGARRSTCRYLPGYTGAGWTCRHFVAFWGEEEVVPAPIIPTNAVHHVLRLAVGQYKMG